MGIIADTTPSNLDKEKEKFLADDTYSPQFTYSQKTSAAELSKWGNPQDHLFEHALTMLKTNPQKEEGNLKILTKKEILDHIDAINQKYKFSPPIEVQFHPGQVAQCYMKKNLINFREPLTYNTEAFSALLAHEIETHFLRKHNHALQPWAKVDFPDPAFRKTEEGLASLHTYMHKSQKILHKSYFSYCATYWAQRHSFREVYDLLVELGKPPIKAWNLTLRSKRGLADTTQPGGLTKDICYFEGMLKVWQWLMQTETDVRDLYLGRIDINHLAEIRTKSITDNLIYPSFIKNQITYLSKIAEIGEINGFEELTQ